MIGVISDTHDNLKAVDKALKILKERGVNKVIHLGDFISPFTLRKFENFRLYGIFGNNDGEKLLLKSIADEFGFVLEEAPLEIEIGKKNFLLLHGYGSVERTKKLVRSFAKSGDYDFILYGHTHRVHREKISETTILNPGEACGYLSGKRTIALLDPEKEDVEIIKF